MAKTLIVRKGIPVGPLRKLIPGEIPYASYIVNKPILHTIGGFLFGYDESRIHVSVDAKSRPGLYRIGVDPGWTFGVENLKAPKDWGRVTVGDAIASICFMSLPIWIGFSLEPEDASLVSGSGGILRRMADGLVSLGVSRETSGVVVQIMHDACSSFCGRLNYTTSGSHFAYELARALLEVKRDEFIEPIRRARVASTELTKADFRSALDRIPYSGLMSPELRSVWKNAHAPILALKEWLESWIADHPAAYIIKAIAAHIDGAMSGLADALSTD